MLEPTMALLSRRGFLRSLVQTVAAVALATQVPVLPDPVKPKPLVEPLDPDMKARLIREFLNTPGGREKLAAAMTLPIRTHIDYNRLGRELIPIQQMPQGAMAVYDENPDLVSEVVR